MSGTSLFVDALISDSGNNRETVVEHSAFTALETENRATNPKTLLLIVFSLLFVVFRNYYYLKWIILFCVTTITIPHLKPIVRLALLRC